MCIHVLSSLLGNSLLVVPQSAVVYQLQRRVRTLRDQLQRRDLHLDLLRKKLSLHEDHCRVRSLLEAERDDANIRLVSEFKSFKVFLTLEEK